MNCEKCKNRKATLFYADEDGSRHALCPACATAQGKLVNYTAAEEEVGERPPYIPAPSLTSMTEELNSSPLYIPVGDNVAVCPKCKLTIGELNDKGSIGCPECFTVFAEALLPILGDNTDSDQGRMPAARRRIIERQRSLSELKAQIKSAVVNENYELAATIRDKIKKLETAI